MHRGSKLDSGARKRDRASLLRSMLFVPADSERKLAKAQTVPADALIVDLEDSVAPARKAIARGLAAEFLRHARNGRAELWVRINALGSEESAADLERIVAARPAGIVLPKPRGVDDVRRLAARLDALEAGTAGTRDAGDSGAILILPIATETPAAVFSLGDYRSAGPRLAALTWGAEDLSTALGAAGCVDADGEWLPPYQLVRSLCLLAAVAAGVPAIDTVFTDLRDPAGLLRHAAAAKRDGFGGKLAIHPEQVEIINGAMRPDAGEIERARRVIAAFAQASGAGVVELDGRMLDRPHLLHAERIVALAAQTDAGGIDPQ